MIQIEVKGEQELQRIIARAPEHIRMAVDKTFSNVTQQIKTEARRLCPVRTGNLRDSIFKRKIAEMTYQVGASAPYAVYVEFGTSHMPARPFMRYAFQTATANFAPTLVREVENELRKIV